MPDTPAPEAEAAAVEAEAAPAEAEAAPAEAPVVSAEQPVVAVQYRVSFQPSLVAVVVEALSEDRAVEAAREALEAVAKGDAVATAV